MLTASGAKLLDFGLAKFRSVGDRMVGEADETRVETRTGARARIESNATASR